LVAAASRKRRAGVAGSSRGAGEFAGMESGMAVGAEDYALSYLFEQGLSRDSLFVGDGKGLVLEVMKMQGGRGFVVRAAPAPGSELYLVEFVSACPASVSVWLYVSSRVCRSPFPGLAGVIARLFFCSILRGSPEPVPVVPIVKASA